MPALYAHMNCFLSSRLLAALISSFFPQNNEIVIRHCDGQCNGCAPTHALKQLVLKRFSKQGKFAAKEQCSYQESLIAVGTISQLVSGCSPGCFVKIPSSWIPEFFFPDQFGEQLRFDIDHGKCPFCMQNESTMWPNRVQLLRLLGGLGAIIMPTIRLGLALASAIG